MNDHIILKRNEDPLAAVKPMEEEERIFSSDAVEIPGLVFSVSLFMAIFNRDGSDWILGLIFCLGFVISLNFTVRYIEVNLDFVGFRYWSKRYKKIFWNEIGIVEIRHRRYSRVLQKCYIFSKTKGLEFLFISQYIPGSHILIKTLIDRAGLEFIKVGKNDIRALSKWAVYQKKQLAGS